MAFGKARPETIEADGEESSALGTQRAQVRLPKSSGRAPQ